MSARRPSLLLPLVLVLVVMSSAGLRPAEAQMQERVFKNREIAEADLAPANFGKYELISGRVTLREDGYGAGHVHYGVRGQRIATTIRLDWREQGRVKQQRALRPGGTELGAWWSPTHQVKVNVKDMNTRDGLGIGALMQLARNATVNLRSRALPWPATTRSLDLSRDINEYRLAGMTLAGTRRQGARASVAYGVAERNWRDVAERVQHYRMLSFDIDWVLPGMDPTKPHVPWKPDPKQHRPTKLRESSSEYIWSPTHFVRIELRGDYYDENRDHKHAFINAAHLARGREIAARLMRRVETLARARDAAMQSPTPAHVEDRPPAQSTSGRGSGTIASASGRFMLIRGGRRINVASGGRIQMGDTIITSAGGSLLIRFDDPTAGQGKTGQLAIAPGTKVKIDVPPHRPGTARVAARIELTEGVVRLARPHRADNPLLEIRLPGRGGVFGLEGTDVVAALHEGHYLLVVREGRVSRRIGNRVVARIGAGTVAKIAPSGELVFRGPVSEEQFREGNERFGVPAIPGVTTAATTSTRRLAPRAGDRFLTEFSDDDLQRRLLAFQKAFRRAEKAYEDLRRRLPTLSEDDAEDAVWDTEDVIEDALSAHSLFRRGFPSAVRESRAEMMERYAPGVQAAEVLLNAYEGVLFGLD